MAGVKISELTAGAAPSGSEQIEVTQGGNSRRLAVSQITNALPSVANVTELRALTTYPDTLFMQGYAEPGDGGGGILYGDSTSMAPTDNGLVFRPTIVSSDAVAGRFLRLINGEKASCKFWGVGLSDDDAPVDDTAQLVAALMSKYAIDLSQSYVYLNGDLALSVPSNALSPGMFSDGSGTIKNIGLLTNRNGLVIAKFPFHIDRINVIYPVSLTSSEPIGGRPFNFRNDVMVANDWRVTNCFFQGGRGAVTINSQCNGIQYCDNIHYEVWMDVVQIIQGLGVHCDRNTFYDCCAGGGGVGAGVIRNSSSFSTAPLQQSTINDNLFISCYPNSAQEAIDLSSAGAFDIQVQSNVIYDQENGIELKTFEQSTFTPDLFQTINISNNVIRLRGTTANGTGINLHQSVPVPPANKSGQHKISGNLITTGAPISSALAIYGVYVEGYDYVDVSDNTIFNVSIGIFLSGLHGFAGTSTGHSVRNNRVRSTGSSLVGVGTLVSLHIKGNQLWALDNPCVNLSNVVSITKLSIEQNSIIADANTGINIAFAQDNCRIRGNDITSATSTGILTTASAGADITALWIGGNHVTPALDAFAIGANGTGITIIDNTVDCPTTKRVWTTAGATVAPGSNCRGTSAAAPVIAGSLGDYFDNNVLGVVGVQPWRWLCTVAGNTGVATWRALNTT